MADKAGYLVKEGERFKTWKKRWMVLKNNVIYYSKKTEQRRTWDHPSKWFDA